MQQWRLKGHQGQAVRPRGWPAGGSPGQREEMCLRSAGCQHGGTTCSGKTPGSWLATGRSEEAATERTSSSWSCKPWRMEGRRRGRRVGARSWGRRGGKVAAEADTHTRETDSSCRQQVLHGHEGGVPDLPALLLCQRQQHRDHESDVLWRQVIHNHSQCLGRRGPHWSNHLEDVGV